MASPPRSLVLLHGFASTFDHTWRQNGWVDILADFDCTAPEIDLPGHGSSARPVDPGSYASVEEDVAALLPAPTGAVGFSAGAEILLRVAVTHPGQFDRLVLLGLGDNVFEERDASMLIDAMDADEEPEDIQARLFYRLARTTGNDPKALSAFLRRPRTPMVREELSHRHLPRSWWSWVTGTRSPPPADSWTRCRRPSSCPCPAWTTSPRRPRSGPSTPP